MEALYYVHGVSAKKTKKGNEYVHSAHVIEVTPEQAHKLASLHNRLGPALISGLRSVKPIKDPYEGMSEKQIIDLIRKTTEREGSRAAAQPFVDLVADLLEANQTAVGRAKSVTGAIDNLQGRLPGTDVLAEIIAANKGIRRGQILFVQNAKVFNVQRQHIRPMTRTKFEFVGKLRKLDFTQLFLRKIG